MLLLLFTLEDIQKKIAQETVREQKHSKAVLLPIPSLTCLPVMHQKDEALAGTGCCMTNLKVLLIFLDNKIS